MDFLNSSSVVNASNLQDTGFLEDFASAVFDWDLLNSTALPLLAGNLTKGMRSLRPHFSTGCSVKWELDKYILVTVLPIIFCISVLGNSLVIVTIVQNKRMRTVTNTFLLNLAISDLLQSVFCMPQGVIMMLFRCFLFGPAMCKLFAYMQPLAVTASAHTLVVIALERYFAICRPLHSRHWQTRSHAIKMIAGVWIISLICNIPSPIWTALTEYAPGQYNCREALWPSDELKQGYMIFLDLLLFILPFLIMSILYGVVILSLWTGMQMDMQNGNGPKFSSDLSSSPQHAIALPEITGPKVTYQRLEDSSTAKTNFVTKLTSTPNRTQRINRSAPLRSTHSERNLIAKRRVIKMLAMIVVEFFVCWMPLFTLRTFVEFGIIGYSTATMHTLMAFLLLAYCSSCTNPVTYCFMNQKFRQAFLAVFGWQTKKTNSRNSSNNQNVHRANRSISNCSSLINKQKVGTPTTPVDGVVPFETVASAGLLKPSTSPSASIRRLSAPVDAISNCSSLFMANTESDCSNRDVRYQNGFCNGVIPSTARDSVPWTR